jgi:hypothetical protein
VQVFDEMTSDATNRQDLYRERPRCPFWVYVAFFAIPAVGFTAVVVILHAISPNGHYVSTEVILLVGSVALGAFPTASQLVVRVDMAGLHIGRTLVIASEIATIRPVAGAELKQLRHEIAEVGDWGVPGAGMLSSGLGMIVAGLALMRTADRRRGMHCSPWQEPAVLVGTPNMTTKQWLIAARDPDRLCNAISQAVERATRCREDSG